MAFRSPALFYTEVQLDTSPITQQNLKAVPAADVFLGQAFPFEWKTCHEAKADFTFIHDAEWPDELASCLLTQCSVNNDRATERSDIWIKQ